MPLDPANFDYSIRRYGMDHDRYDWSMLKDRTKITWPDGKNIALWITVAVEFFPLNDDGIPFKTPGSLTKPYPDLQSYTWRDYGNRVGIYRMMQAFDDVNIHPNWAVNAAIAENLPGLMKDIAARDEEVIAHGYDMASPHYGGMKKDDEQALIKNTLDILRPMSPKPIRGWMSPGKSESENTPDLLAEVELQYFCDWPNDDLPYNFRTSAGLLIAMPHSTGLDDRQIIIDYKHDEAAFLDQIKDHYRYLSREAMTGGGRVFSLNLHPWVIGQSHRISTLEAILEFFAGKDDIWMASGTEIADHMQTSGTP